MNNNYLKIIAFVLLCWMAVEANAQMNRKWTIGLKGGWNWINIDRSNMSRIDETYSPFGSFDCSIQAKYAFTDWLAIRADFSAMTRSYRMDHNLHYGGPFGNINTMHHYIYTSTFEAQIGGKVLEGTGHTPDQTVLRKDHNGNFKAHINAAIEYIQNY